MELKVKNTAQAVEIVLTYLQSRESQAAPAPGLKWQEKTIYSTGPQDYIISSKLFSSDNWLIEVYQGVAPLINTVYQITLFNTQSHHFWEGSVRADGSLTEVSPFKLLSAQESSRKSEEFSSKTQVAPPKPGGYGH
jgi:hypothetical protein